MAGRLHSIWWRWLSPLSTLLLQPFTLYLHYGHSLSWGSPAVGFHSSVFPGHKQESAEAGNVASQTSALFKHAMTSREIRAGRQIRQAPGLLEAAVRGPQSPRLFLICRNIWWQSEPLGADFWSKVPFKVSVSFRMFSPYPLTDDWNYRPRSLT